MSEKTAEKISSLVSWVREQENAICDNIEIKYIDDVYQYGGVLKKLIVPENDVEQKNTDETNVIIQIPLNIVLNSKMAKITEFGQTVLQCCNQSYIEEMIKKCGEGSSPDFGNHDIESNNFCVDAILLYLFILHEKSKQNSLWKNYLDLLPDSIDTPLFYSNEELDELQGTNLLKSVNGIRSKLLSIHKLLFPYLSQKFPTLFPPEHFCFDKFVWAYSIVWSRVFPITYEGDKLPTPTLLPFIDILNHRYNSKITYFTDWKNNSFSLRTNSTLGVVGEQVFNNYGAKSNDSFLLSYGFVVENNSEDTYYVQIGFSENNDILLSEKKLLLEALNLRLGYYLSKYKIPNDLIVSMRICCMNEEEMYFTREMNDLTMIKERIVSVRNEVKALSVLKHLLRSRLNSIISSQEEDQELINSNTVGQRKRNMIVYRMGQREILQNAIQSISNMQIQFAQSANIPKQSLQFGFISSKNIKNTSSSEKYWLQKYINKDIQNKIEIVPDKITNRSYLIASLKDSTANDKIHEKFVSCSDAKTAIDSITSVDTENTVIASGETILSIPHSETINFADILETEFGMAMRSTLNNEDIIPQVVISLYLILEKYDTIHSSGKWNTFLSTLPDQFSTPLFLEDDSENENLENYLQNTSLCDEAMDLKDQLRELYETIIGDLECSEVFKEMGFICDSFTFSRFLWAYTVWNTLSIDNETTILPIPFSMQSQPISCGKVTLLDILKTKEKIYEVRAVTPFMQGEKIVSNFELLGLSNRELFLKHGHCVKDNVHDILQVTLDISQDVLQKKKNKRKLLNIFRLGLDHYMNEKIKIPKQLLDTMRILFMDDFEGDKYLKNVVSLTATEKLLIKRDLSIQTEDKVFSTIQSILKTELALFDSTISQDEEKLEQLQKIANSGSWDMSNANHMSIETFAIIYRLKQKQLLEKCVTDIQIYQPKVV